MTPPCTHPLAELSDLLDDRLGPDARKIVEVRLARCAGCQETYATLGSLREVLAGLPKEPAPASLASSVIAAIRREQEAFAPAPAPKSPWRRFHLLRAAAVLLAALAGGSVIWDGYLRPRLTPDELPHLTASAPAERPPASPAPSAQPEVAGAPRTGMSELAESAVAPPGEAAAADARGDRMKPAGRARSETASAAPSESRGRGAPRPSDRAEMPVARRTTLVDPAGARYAVATRRDPQPRPRDWSSLGDPVLASRGLQAFLEAGPLALGVGTSGPADSDELSADVVVVTGLGATAATASALARAGVTRWDLASGASGTLAPFRLSLVRSERPAPLLASLEDLPNTSVQVFRHGAGTADPSIFLLLTVDP